MLADIAAVFTLIGLTAYVVLGGADFGAGFWDLTAGGAEPGAPVRAMIKRAMAPVWEANHVWLIFVLVMLWTAFPRAFASIFSTLAIPLFLGASAGAIAAGEVPVGNAAGEECGSWTGPLPVFVGVLAVVTGAHLAAVFLGADSLRAGR